MLFNLSPSWARRFQVLGAVSLDFWLPTLASFYFVAQFLQTYCKFRPIDGRPILLRFVQFPRLQRSRVTIRSLRDVEEHDMRMKLRRCIAIHRAGAVVLKLGRNPFASSLGGKITPQPCLDETLHFAQCDRNTVSVGITDTLVAANKGGQ